MKSNLAIDSQQQKFKHRVASMPKLQEMEWKNQPEKKKKKKKKIWSALFETVSALHFFICRKDITRYYLHSGGNPSCVMN